jgi:hypothetical protein
MIPAGWSLHGRKAAGSPFDLLTRRMNNLAVCCSFSRNSNLAFCKVRIKIRRPGLIKTMLVMCLNLSLIENWPRYFEHSLLPLFLQKGFCVSINLMIAVILLPINTYKNMIFFYFTMISSFFKLELAILLLNFFPKYHVRVNRRLDVLLMIVTF